MKTYTCVFVLLNSDKTWRAVTISGLTEEIVVMLEGNYQGADAWMYEHVSCVHAGPIWINTFLSSVDEEIKNVPVKRFMHLN